jgi:hypothetical protein
LLCTHDDNRTVNRSSIVAPIERNADVDQPLADQRCPQPTALA